MAITALSTSLRQQDVSAPYLTRYFLPLAQPENLPIQQWRNAVKSQEAVGIARDTLISYMVSTPWRIEPKDPDAGNKYDSEIQYFTDLFTSTDGGYEDHVELVLQDFLDTPLGGCTELVRDPDEPGGRVVNFQNMDAATLFPTVFRDFPIVQRVPGAAVEPVIFPKHALSRIGYTPRPEIRQRGWYMAPPERIYLALQMLIQGDQYYWKLLQDTPELGILDLGDMEMTAAESWLKSWRDLLSGVDPFKIPVLYEHTGDVKYIQFNRPPTDIIYDRVMISKASFAAAGYGISLSDMGIVTDQGTLAGTIRGERRSERTGFAKVRVKLQRYWNNMLPPYLQYVYIERDDERLVAKGRARLANSMAMRNLTDGGILEKQDAQQQLVADGLITVPLTAVGPNQDTSITEPNRLVSRELGNPIPASSGGNGEITNKADYTKDDVRAWLDMSKVWQDDQVLGFDLLGSELRDLLQGVLAPEGNE